MDVGVAVRVGHRGVEELPALGVVGGHRADQRELHLGHFSRHLAIGVDHPHRILPRIEARHLADQRPVDVDAELIAHVRRVLGGEGHVLGGQRVDGGRADPHPAIRAVHSRRHVAAHVPDRGVVLADEGHQVLDRVGVRRREVDVAAPDPGSSLVGNVPADRCGLGIVDDYHVPSARDLRRVELVVALEDLPLLVREGVRVALQRVVEALRGVVELLAAQHHLPFGLDTDVVHERDQRVEDLGDAAAEGGRREVEHAQALKVLRELADLRDQWPSGEVCVVGKALVTDRNRL